jgi:restriction system protein
MARRKGGLTELLDVASKLPWKVAVALVPISFLVFHLIAAGFAAVPHATTIADMGSVVIHQGIYTAATIFQYIVPFALFIGAAVSYVKRSRSIALFDEVQSDPNGNVAGLGWQDFERLVGEGFRHRGFQVTERGGAGPDGGVDLALARGHERFLVQCKQWRPQQVGVSVVRELYGVMAGERVAGGYVVTSGRFTKDAKEFAAGRNIELMDGRGLEVLLRDGRADGSKPKSPIVNLKAARNKVEPMPVATPPRSATESPTDMSKWDPDRQKAPSPTCPRCKTPMVLRTATKGGNVGSSFWGCAQYPKCRQTMAVG